MKTRDKRKNNKRKTTNESEIGERATKKKGKMKQLRETKEGTTSPLPIAVKVQTYLQT